MTISLRDDIIGLINQILQVNCMNIKDIIKNKDVQKFRECMTRDFSKCFIVLRYDFLDSISYENMNSLQQTLYLCSLLDDACQADTIINFWDDDETGENFFLLPDTAEALRRIDAAISAGTLLKLINYMPAGTFENKKMPEQKWFDADENYKFFMGIDSVIANYPDGNITDLCRKYVMAIDNSAALLLQNI